MYPDVIIWNMLISLLGHLRHSGDLLLWFGVHCRASTVNYSANPDQIWYVEPVG